LRRREKEPEAEGEHRAAVLLEDDSEAYGQAGERRPHAVRAAVVTRHERHARSQQRIASGV
jgi:hypothetical protein